MALRQDTYKVNSTVTFQVGQQYDWTVEHVLGLDTIRTKVVGVDTLNSTITLQYDDSLLPSSIVKLTACNLSCPVLVDETCCDITYYDTDTVLGLDNLEALGVVCNETNLSLGEHYIRVGLDTQRPDEVWQYNQEGDPCDLSNWTLIRDSSGGGGGGGTVESDGTLSGDGAAVSPLSVNPFSITAGDAPSSLDSGPVQISPTENIQFWSAGGLAIVAADSPNQVNIEPENMSVNLTATGAPVNPPDDTSRTFLHFAEDGLYIWNPSSLAWVAHRDPWTTVVNDSGIGDDQIAITLTAGQLALGFTTADIVGHAFRRVNSTSELMITDMTNDTGSSVIYHLSGVETEANGHELTVSFRKS